MAAGHVAPWASCPGRWGCSTASFSVKRKPFPDKHSLQVPMGCTREGWRRAEPPSESTEFSRREAVRAPVRGKRPS